MRLEHFEKYLSHRFLLDEYILDDRGDVSAGRLVSLEDNVTVEIKDGVPIFDAESYVENFGLQWNTFSKTQLDSETNYNITRKRLVEGTGWDLSKIEGEVILEAGSGAGRFTEIFRTLRCDVVTFDLSNAVKANRHLNRAKNVFFLQASIFALPLKKKSFDRVFCYGVVQHTPDPIKAVSELVSMVRAGGTGSIDFYRRWRFPNVWSTPKRIWRPLTTRIPPQVLLKIVKFYIPLWLPVDTLLRSIPYFGSRFLAFVPIPCWNYLHLNLKYRKRLEWAILDTFDALSAKYDREFTLAEVKNIFKDLDVSEFNVYYGSNGIVANFKR